MLHHNDADSKDLESHVRVEMISSTSMVVIQTEVPWEGEYALTIFSCRKQESTNASSLSYIVKHGVNVCNYLLSTVFKKPEVFTHVNVQSTLAT